MLLFSLRAFLPVSLLLPDPDVAVGHLGAMVLQEQREPTVRRVGWITDVGGVAFQYNVVLHQDAVQHHRNQGGRLQLAVGAEAGSAPVDIVDLPLTIARVGVGERCLLLVDTSHHAVHVGRVVIAVEHLHLVLRLQEDAAVAAILTMVLFRSGRPELDMELHITEMPVRHDAPRAGLHRQLTVADHPPGIALLTLPLREVLPVEQDDGVGGCRCRGFTRLNLRRYGSIPLGFFRHHLCGDIECQ